jgi:HTH-type transcriptional regulator/antitoxin HigA
MTQTTFDPERYAQLLAEVRPGIIEDPQEHERLLTIGETMMEKGDELSPEEAKLLALLVFLIEAYEASDEEPEEEESEPLPHEMIHRLLASRGLAVTDIEHIFGNPLATSEVLSGARPITKGQAKDLGRFFQVPTKLFRT